MAPFGGRSSRRRSEAISDEDTGAKRCRYRGVPQSAASQSARGVPPTAGLVAATAMSEARFPATLSVRLDPLDE